MLLRFFTFIFLLTFFTVSFSQVGINTTTPQASLEISNTNNATITDGLLLPRISRLRAQSIINPELSTIIYIDNITTGTQTGTCINVNNVGFYYFNGTTWEKLITEKGIAKFYRNSTQTTGDDIVYNTEAVNTISKHISLDPLTGIITLNPGVYKLRGSAGGSDDRGFSNFQTNKQLLTGFYNHTTASFIGQGGSSFAGTSLNRNAVPYNASTAIINVTTPVEISLRIALKIGIRNFSARSDFAEDRVGRAWVTIEKIN